MPKPKHSSMLSDEPTGSELATSGKSDLASPSGHYDPSDQSRPEERTIPFMRLLQHSSTEVKDGLAEIGDLLTSTGVNLGKWVVVTPLLYKRGARKFDRETNELECKSNDGINGSRYGRCDQCEFDYRVWKTDSRGRDVAPECHRTGVFPCVILACENFPDDAKGLGIAALQLARTSWPVAKQIITQHDHGGLPYYGYKWRIPSRTRTFPKGAAQVFQASFLGMNPPEQVAAYEEMCRDIAGTNLEEPVTTEFPPDASDDKIPF